MDFDPGLNVIVGPNEAGKSTLFSALELLLLVPTKLTVPQFKRHVARFLPRPGGDFVEAELLFSTAEGDYRLAKRWGADPYSLLESSAGTVRDQSAVAEAMTHLLPVSEGSFRSVFLNAQRGIADPVGGTDGGSVRRDLGEVLRRAAFETGGISIEEFRTTLHQRLDETYRRWDEDNDAPEQRRPGEGRWQKGAGVLTKAFYALEDAKERLRSLQIADDQIAELSARLEEHIARRDEAVAFVQAYGELHKQVLRGREIASEIALVDEKAKERGEAAKNWPVLEHRIKEEGEDLAAKEADLAQTQSAVETIDRAIEAAERLRQHTARNQEVAELEAELEATPSVDQDAVERLEEIEAGLARISVELSTGSLHGRIIADGDAKVAWTADDNEVVEQTLSRGETFEVDGRRILSFELDTARIEVTAGDIDVHALRDQRDRLTAERDTLAQALGTAVPEEARRLRLARVDVEKRLGRARGLLDAVEVRAEDEEAVALALELLEPSDRNNVDPVSELKRARREFDTRRLELTNKHAALEASVRAARAGLADFTARYGDVDSLLAELGDLRHQKKLLEAETAAGLQLPEGFASVEEFRQAYHHAEVAQREETLACAELRGELSTAEASRPEESLDDVSEEVARNEYELDRLKRRGRALRRVAKATDRLLAQMDADTFVPFLERFSHLAQSVVGGAYEPRPSRDVLEPVFHRRDGVEIPYELLSAGTRDSLGLAIRLALAASLLAEEAKGFVVLDDPLVELDKSRREAAARLIEAFAENQQVAYFTCHDEHAEVFRGATVTPLGPAAW